MKKFKVEIRENPNNGFEFGNCAEIAIASAFEIDPKNLSFALDFIGIENHKDGLTFIECKRIINKLSKSQKIEVIYRPNTIKVDFDQFIFFHQKGTYLIMFEQHLSYMKDGIVYDDYLLKYMDTYTKVGEIPTGFWTINSKTTKVIKEITWKSMTNVWRYD